MYSVWSSRSTNVSSSPMNRFTSGIYGPDSQILGSVMISKGEDKGLLHSSSSIALFPNMIWPFRRRLAETTRTDMYQSEVYNEKRKKTLTRTWRIYAKFAYQRKLRRSSGHKNKNMLLSREYCWSSPFMFKIPIAKGQPRRKCRTCAPSFAAA